MSEDSLRGQQILVLPEGSNRVLGRDAQRTNIAVAYAVANAIRTTLGPRGMDKMLVSELGDIVITNDGATILEEMNVEHPAANVRLLCTNAPVFNTDFPDRRLKTQDSRPTTQSVPPQTIYTLPG